MPIVYGNDNVEADKKARMPKQDSAREREYFEIIDPQYEKKDMVMSQEMQKQLSETVGYVKCADKVYKDWGLEKVMRRKKGVFVNLYGPSGTGKTMMAHIIAREINRKVMQINYAEIESKYVGETSKNIKHIFEYTGEDCILFFDEADALLSKRVTEMSSAADVSVNQTRSVLLKLLNNYSGVCVFATNFLSNYDVAFLRRMTKHIKFELPDLEQRKMIWKHFLVNELPNTVDVDRLSEDYPQISGSDIENAVLSSAIRAAVDRKEVILTEDISDVLNEIVDVKKKNGLLKIEGGDK